MGRSWNPRRSIASETVRNTRSMGTMCLCRAGAAHPAPPSRSPDPRRVLVLGSGAGGTAAAFALREAGFSGEIIMIGDEASQPYDRTVLSKFVLTDMDPSEIPPLAPEQDWTVNASSAGKPR